MRKLFCVAVFLVSVFAQDTTDFNGSFNVQGTLKSQGAAARVDFSLAINTRPFTEVTSDPSGSCTGGSVLNKLTGVLWTCVFPSGGAITGTWTPAASPASSQAARTFFAGPVSGAPAVPGWRTLALTDMPTCPTTTAGQVLFRWNGTAVICGGVDGADVTSGVIPAARGGAGAINGLLKANGSGVVSAATAGTDFQAPITVTATGTSGPATLIGNVINIPQYSGGGGASLPCAGSIASNQVQISAPCSGRINQLTVTAGAAVITSTGSGAIAGGLVATGLQVWPASGSPTITCVSGCVVAGSAPTVFAPVFGATVTSGTLSAYVDTRQTLSTSSVAPASDASVAVATAVDGTYELSIPATVSYTARTTAPVQTGTNAARPTTCIVGQLYNQTDGTVGLYRHSGAAGACSWSAVGGGASVTKVPIEQVLAGYGGYTATGTPVNPVGWAVQTSGPAFGFAGGSLPFTLQFANTTTGEAIAFGTIPNGWDGGAITVQLAAYVAAVNAWGNATILARAACVANASLLSTTTYGTDASLTVAIASPAGGGESYVWSGAVVPAGTCAAGRVIKVSLRRDGSDTADVRLDVFEAKARYLVNLQ